MRALDRKLLRDLNHLKGQVTAIALVMACGVATLVMSSTTLESLQRTQLLYYDRYGFADVFAHLKRAPESLAERISEIPGVAHVEARILVDVTLAIEGMVEPAVGRLVSVPERGQPLLNRLHLRTGRWPDPQRGGEVLASETFAEANGFKPGDTLSAVINGRYQQLHIVGLALSPEFVYEIQGSGGLVPDNEHFGVLWMSKLPLAAAFDMEGAFNDIALSLMRGASEAEVLRRLDRLIEPYGGQVAYGRANHYSHRRLTDELLQLGAMSRIWPGIFLAVAAFLFNVVISRLVGLQREQVAVLKAFGYSRREIGLHYVMMISLVVLLATVLGTVAGTWLGRGMTELYIQFFRFPFFEYRVDSFVVLAAFLISAAAALTGASGPLRKAMNLPPAEAMRPEPPASFRPASVERMGLQGFFGQATRMILRQLERYPLRSLLTSVGISAAVAVLTLGNCMSDAAHFVIDFQFFQSHRYDAMVSFTEPSSHRSLHELSHLPGATRVEPFRSVPVRLSRGPASRRQAVTGLGSERDLMRLVNAGLDRVNLAPSGLVLSQQLAELLRVRPGQTVRMEVLEGKRPSREVVVSGMVEDFGGLSAYMDIQALNRLLEEGSVLSGGFLEVDPSRLRELYGRIKQTPGIASVTLRETSLRLLRELMDDLLLRMQAIYAVFAGIIAFGIVYNSARISLSERGRELATLRVLGFTRAEISAILLGEVGVLTILALPLGLLLGNGFARLAIAAVETETQRFPFVIEISTYAYAVAVTLVAALVSGLLVRRRIDHLDLVAVLKSAE